MPEVYAASRISFFATTKKGYVYKFACPITLAASVIQRPTYDYWCVGGSGIDPTATYACNRFPAPQCKVLQTWPINLCGLSPYGSMGCGGDLHVDQMRCSPAIDGATPTATSSETVVTTKRDESQCGM